MISKKVQLLIKEAQKEFLSRLDKKREAISINANHVRDTIIMRSVFNEDYNNIKRIAELDIMRKVSDIASKTNNEVVLDKLLLIRFENYTEYLDDSTVQGKELQEIIAQEE